MRDSRFIKELGITIPTELNPDDWAVYILCAPASLEWSMALRSAVRMMARGRFWGRDDRETSIKDAQKIGRLIEMSLQQCDFSLLAEAIRYLADTVNISQTLNINNSNNNAGGGGGGGCYPLPSDDDTPVTYIPLPNTNDPNLENVPSNPPDDEAETPPDGFEDWPSFVSARCRYANYAVDQYIDTIEAIRKIENSVGVLGEIVSLLLFLLPGPWKTGKLMTWIVEIAAWLLAFFSISDKTIDALEFLQQSIQENRQEVTCIIYKYWASERTETDLKQLLGDWYRQFMETIEAPNDLIENCLKLLDIILSYKVLQQIFDWAATKIPVDYVAPIDCAECEGVEGPFELPEGYEWERVKFGTLSYTGTAVSPIMVNVADNEIRFGFASHTGDLWMDAQVTPTGSDSLALILQAVGTGFTENKAIPCVRANNVPGCPTTTSTQRRALGYWVRYLPELPTQIVDAITALPVAYNGAVWPVNPDNVRVANYPSSAGLELTLKGWMIVESAAGGGGGGAG